MSKALIAWMLVAGAVAAPATTAPREVVQTAVGRVIAVLQRSDTDGPDPSPARRMTLEQRRNDIRRIASDLFDFDEMARRSMTRYWTARTAEEQAEFIQLFTELLERTYIGRIEGYAGERLVYLGDSVDGSYATVRSKVITRRKTETPLDYRLHLRDGRWKVYDVLIDHVSFVATYRSAFSRIIQRESYAELVDRLRRQNVEASALVRWR